MAEKDGTTREERLAAKLRENLRRRKAQARALDESDSSPITSKGESEADAPPPLSKTGPSR